MNRAGTPPTTVHGSTSRVTTAPAATTSPSPIFMLGSIVTRAPVYTQSSMETGPPAVAKVGLSVSCSCVKMRYSRLYLRCSQCICLRVHPETYHCLYRMMTDMHAGWLKEAASPIYYAIFWNVYAKNITVQRVTNRMRRNVPRQRRTKNG